MGKRICIVGAGVSGLAAIKACLEEGLQPHCFEQNTDLGGIWNYTDDISRPSVYQGLHMNSAKAFSVYSDFPHNQQVPNYMHHTDFLAYLKQYSQHFDLARYIQFETSVLSIEPVGDSDDVVSWKVTYRTQGEKNPGFDMFDGVMLAAGMYQQPNIPNLQGLDSYKGTILHSQHIKRPQEQCQAKTVLIVGFGNSGSELASQFFHGGNQVLISKNYDGGWVTRRNLIFGLPWDVVVYNGITHLLLKFTLGRWILESMLNILTVDHDVLGYTPERHRIGDKLVILSDELLPYIFMGKFKLRPRVDHFEEEYVVFEDGSKEKVDVVVFGSGYTYQGGLLPNDLYPVTKSGKFICYKNVFLTNPKYRSLGFIGHLLTSAAVCPLYELQSRWFAQVFKGKVQLPSQNKMQEWIEKCDRMTYTSPNAKGIQIPVVLYTDMLNQIAEEFGANPSAWKYLLSDPGLSLRLLFGLYIPARYRITGPHPWQYSQRAVRNALPAVWANVVPAYSCTQTSMMCCLKGLCLLILGGLSLILLLVGIMWCG